MLFKLSGTERKGQENRLKKILDVIVKLFAMPLGAFAIYTIISSFEDESLPVGHIAAVVFIIVVLALALSNKTERNSLK